MEEEPKLEEPPSTSQPPDGEEPAAIVEGGYPQGKALSPELMGEGGPNEGPLRVMELCPRNRGVGWVFRQRGHQVVTMNSLGSPPPKHMGGVNGWGFREVYPRGHFDVVVCILPDLAENPDWANNLVHRLGDLLEVLEFHKAPKWFLVGEQRGGYNKVGPLRGLKHVTMDTCSFPGAVGKHRLHVWGGDHLKNTPSRVCRYVDCPHDVQRKCSGKGPSPMIPSQLVGYLMGWPQELEPAIVPRSEVEDLALVGVLDGWAGPGELEGIPPAERFCDEGEKLLPADLEAICEELHPTHVEFVRGFVQASDPVGGAQIEGMRAAIHEDFRDTVFNTTVGGGAPSAWPVGRGRDRPEARGGARETKSLPPHRGEACRVDPPHRQARGGWTD